MKMAVGNRLSSISRGMDDDSARIQSSFLWAMSESVVQRRIFVYFGCRPGADYAVPLFGFFTHVLLRTP